MFRTSANDITGEQGGKQNGARAITESTLESVPVPGTYEYPWHPYSSDILSSEKYHHWNRNFPSVTSHRCNVCTPQPALLDQACYRYPIVTTDSPKNASKSATPWEPFVHKADLEGFAFRRAEQEKRKEGKQRIRVVTLRTADVNRCACDSTGQLQQHASRYAQVLLRLEYVSLVSCGNIVNIFTQTFLRLLCWISFLLWEQWLRSTARIGLIRVNWFVVWKVRCSKSISPC